LVFVAGCDQNPNDQLSNTTGAAEEALNDDDDLVCLSTFIWRPTLPPGHLIDIDPGAFQDRIAQFLVQTLSDPDASAAITEVAGFAVVVRHAQCELSGIELQSRISESALSISYNGENLDFTFTGISPLEMDGRSIAEFNEAFIAWDRKLLGHPSVSDEQTQAAGPNGFGGCNIYGVFAPALIVRDDETRAFAESLLSELLRASLEEANNGTYDYVPLLFFTGRVIGVTVYGDCEEARVRAAAFLIRSVERMSSAFSQEHLAFRLFEPNQIDSRRPNEIVYAVENGLVEPLGMSFAASEEATPPE